VVLDVTAALFAVGVLCAPIFVLSPIIDRLFESGSLRAIFRRALGIDRGALLTDVHEHPPRRRH
jgi:hypothetical protein